MPVAAFLSGNGPGEDDLPLMGTGHFKGLKSKYIREKIRATPFERRDYVYELVWLYQNIVGAASSKTYNRLAAKYPEEHLALLKEQRPDQYRAALKKLMAEKIEEKRDNREKCRTVEQQKTEWIEAGGSV